MYESNITKSWMITAAAPAAGVTTRSPAPVTHYIYIYIMSIHRMLYSLHSSYLPVNNIHSTVNITNRIFLLGLSNNIVNTINMNL